MASLVSLKGVSIAFLVVVLASASPVFAALDGIVLNPEAGCPRTVVLLFLPEDGVFVDGGPLKLSSYPDGLIADYQCASIASYQGGNSGLGLAGYQVGNNQEEPICRFTVSESASCGTYHVILEYDEKPIGEPADFEVLCACPTVGGCVQPVHSFALLSPWLAVIGLVGCVGTAVVVRKKHHS